MKILLLVLSMMFATMASADGVLAKMEEVSGGIQITVNDFAHAANSFEVYTCNIDFGGWVYTMSAVSTTINSKKYYRCTDQGSLQSGVEYKVFFTFEDFQDYKSKTADFTLKAN